MNIVETTSCNPIDVIKVILGNRAPDELFGSRSNKAVEKNIEFDAGSIDIRQNDITFETSRGLMLLSVGENSFEIRLCLKKGLERFYANVRKDLGEVYTWSNDIPADSRIDLMVSLKSLIDIYCKYFLEYVEKRSEILVFLIPEFGKSHIECLTNGTVSKGQLSTGTVVLNFDMKVCGDISELESKCDKVVSVARSFKDYLIYSKCSTIDAAKCIGKQVNSTPVLDEKNKNLTETIENYFLEEEYIFNNLRSLLDARDLRINIQFDDSEIGLSNRSIGFTSSQGDIVFKNMCDEGDDRGSSLIAVKDFAVYEITMAKDRSRQIFGTSTFPYEFAQEMLLRLKGELKRFSLLLNSGLLKEFVNSATIIENKVTIKSDIVSTTWNTDESATLVIRLGNQEDKKYFQKLKSFMS